MMLFNPSRGARERGLKVLTAAAVVLYLGLLCSIAFVAGHFIVKF